MRVEASKVLAQDVRNRNPDKPYEDEVEAPEYGRTSEIARVQAAAIEFANEFLSSFELPSVPILRLGTTHGLESTNTEFAHASAVVIVQASIRAMSGYVIRLDLAIPLYKGEFHKPSIAHYNGKRHVLSQDFIDSIIATVDSKRPSHTKPMTPNWEVVHKENAEGPMFGAPRDPTEWSLLVTERYT